MSEKIKKQLIILAYQAVFAAGMFLFILAMRHFAPELTEKISVIWTKNTDLKKVGRLLLEAGDELLPFKKIT